MAHQSSSFSNSFCHFLNSKSSKFSKPPSLCICIKFSFLLFLFSFISFSFICSGFASDFPIFASVLLVVAVFLSRFSSFSKVKLSLLFWSIESCCFLILFFSLFGRQQGVFGLDFGHLLAFFRYDRVTALDLLAVCLRRSKRPWIYVRKKKNFPSEKISISFE